jgi:hypothetical protein
MTNNEFLFNLENMYAEHSAIGKKETHTVNELVYVLRMAKEDYQLNVVEGNKFMCIPSVEECFIPWKTLSKDVVSVEFDEETYEECGIKLVIVYV